MKKNDIYEKYVKELEQGYLKIYQIFETHAFDDVSMIDKIYDIVKPIKDKI